MYRIVICTRRPIYNANRQKPKTNRVETQAKERKKKKEYIIHWALYRYKPTHITETRFFVLFFTSACPYRPVCWRHHPASSR